MRKGKASAVSVVTGGAGGMGLITATIVGRDNFVVICDVDRDRLASAAAQLEEESDVECRPVFCDITDKNSVADLVAAASAVGPSLR